MLNESVSRRELLRRGAGVGLGLLGVTGLSAIRVDGQAPIAPRPDPRFPQVPTWNNELREIAPSVYAYIQGGGPGRDNVSISNGGAIVGDEGVMVIDALAAPMHAKRFVEALRKVTDKPFRHLINTHHHTDHIGGNQYFMPAEIVGHPYCRQEVLKMIPTATPLWAKRDGWADGTEPKQVLPPTTIVDGKITYYYGTTVVEIFPMVPAHTYGDLVIHLPQHNILFAGDIAFYYVAPFCQNAHPSNWIALCDQINAMPVTTIVPGHGPIGGKRELGEMQEYLVVLKREARRRYDAKMTPGAAAADIRMGKFDNWIGPERIIMDTVRFYAEFAGTLTPDVDSEGIRKATEEYNAIKTRSA
jgi:glyoxylase-like metal-dependent hydrolase (beta-lactamase superfamily II)